MSRRSGPAGQHTIQSVTRAARLLKAFMLSHTSLGVTELSRALSLPPSTVHRLLATLVREDLLTYHPDSGRYSLSALLVSSSPAAAAIDQLRQASLPFVEKLAVELREDVGLAVLKLPYVLFLYVLEEHRTPHVNIRPGSITPAHCTASGKLLLASLPPSALARVLREDPLPMYTRFTITSPAILARELERIRERGVALEDQEFIPDVRSMAVPVRDNGEIVAALAVIGPRDHLNDQKLALCQARLRGAAEAISRKLASMAGPERELLAHEVLLDLGSGIPAGE
jgi:DNA-binding IclR family transcriptional regulator